MSTVTPARAPTPRLKAPATASTSAQTASATVTATTKGSSSASASAPGPALASSSASSPSRLRSPPSSTSAAPATATATPTSSRSSSRPASTDFLSDKATSAFVRRILCPQHHAAEKQKKDRGRSTAAPVEDLLPPLTSRNDVDLQLYALLAVIIRDFVQSWYNKITPDETFVAEVVQIIAHCTRALEQRLRKVDLESLFFDELPDLLDRHITAYRIAHNPVAPPPTRVDPREVYHSLCPLAPLSPVPKPEQDPESATKQQENEALYRELLVQGVLAVLLPTEDLENECLTSLVGQIFAELIIGNVVVNKLSQPWMIWECLIIVARVVDRKKQSSSGRNGSKSNRDRSEKGAKRGTTLEDEGVAEAMASGASSDIPSRTSRRPWSFSGVFWSIAQWVFLVFTTVRILVIALATSSSLPARSAHVEATWGETNKSKIKTKASPPPPSSSTSAPAKVPIVTFKLWTCIGELIELETRMPWLSGAFSMLQLGAVRGPGGVAALDGPLDRLLSHAIYTRLLDPSHLPPLLRSVRGALFPNNALGVSTLVGPSSDTQLRALRRRCASALLALVPRWLSGLYLGGRGLRTGPKGGGGGGDEIDDQFTHAAGVGDNGRQDSSSSGGRRSDEDEGEAERLHADVDADAGAGAGFSQTRHARRRSQGQTGVVVGTDGHGGGGPIVGEGDGKAETATKAEAKAEVEAQAQVPSNGEKEQIKEEDKSEGGDDDGGYHEDEEEEEQQRIISEVEEGILDVFSDEYCNKHLLYGVLDLVLVRLVPELAEKGVAELREERLS